MAYRFQPILVTDVASAIAQAIETKNNEGEIYEIGGPTVINFENITLYSIYRYIYIYTYLSI